MQSPTFFKTHVLGPSFDNGFSLYYKGSFASSYFITFSSSTYSPSAGSGLSQVSLPLFKIFCERCTQFYNDDKNSNPGIFHSSVGSIYFLSSALTLYIVLGTKLHVNPILTNWHFKRCASLPGKNGLVKTVLSKFPVNVYLIFLAIFICWGVIIGSYLQFTYNKSVATQYVVLFTPVPFGSTSGGNYPYSAAYAGDYAMK